MPLNEETGGEFTANDQAMGSAPEVEQEIVEEVEQENIETPTELSDIEKLRQQTENLNEALRQEREERKRYRDELEATRQQIPTYKSPEQIEADRVKAEAQRALKELGFMTREEIEQQQVQERQAWERENQEKEAKQALEQDVENLAKEFDGKNGKPKFDKSKVIDYLNHGSEKRIFNLRAAYIDKHLPEIAASLYSGGHKPTNFPTQSNVQKNGSMPDFSQMNSNEIIKWQQSQGLAQS